MDLLLDRLLQSAQASKLSSVRNKILAVALRCSARARRGACTYLGTVDLVPPCKCWSHEVRARLLGHGANSFGDALEVLSELNITESVDRRSIAALFL